MGRQSGVYQDAKSGRWRVDRVHRGERLQGRFDTHQEAVAWLTARLAAIDANGTVKVRSMTLAEAATRYLLEEEAAGEKLALDTEAYVLAPVVELCGNVQLHQVHDGTLKPFVEARLNAGLAPKTINASLSAVQHLLNVAHERWRVDIGGGQDAPLLLHVPKLTKRPMAGKQRTPRPISWEQQRGFLAKLPAHLGKMALFMLNTGARDDVVCRLRWDWEIETEVRGERVSVFEVPFDPTQVRKKSKREFDYVVCNSVAQSIVDAQRGLHDEFVFVWRRERTSQNEYQLRRHEKEPPMAWQPVATMNNTAWQRARQDAELGDLHVHDLRHTVGLRLREVEVLERTIADVLWHQSGKVTHLYTQAQVAEIHAALERIAREPNGHKNRALTGLSKGAQRRRVPSGSLQRAR